MGRQSGWRHELGSYKACPNEAVTNFLCLHKCYVWNCPCLIWCCLSVFNFSEMASKQQQAFRMCVHPCPRYFTGRDTHVLCVACLGEDRAWSALKSCWGTGWTCVLQGAAVSGERISQGPPGNVVFLGCPPPPRRVSERSVQMLPLGLPFQDVVLTVKLHINPETSLERLVPLVEFWQCGNFCQIYLVLYSPADYRKRVSIQFGSRPPKFMGMFSTRWFW